MELKPYKTCEFLQKDCNRKKKGKVALVLTVQEIRMEDK